jgi:hypothetical protein
MVSIKPAPPARRSGRAVHKQPLLHQQQGKKKTWRETLTDGGFMSRLILVSGLLISAGIAVGVAGGLGKFSSSSSSSSNAGNGGASSTGGTPLGTGLEMGNGLAPLFVMNAYPATVAPGSVVASSFWDGSCDAYTFEVPQAAELGVQQQSFLGNAPKYVLYQSGRVYDAQRVVPISSEGNPVNVGALSLTISFWAWFTYIDPSADYMILGSDSTNYDGPLVLMDHANGWCLSDNTNRGKCPGSVCVIPPGFVCSGLGQVLTSVWNMVTLVYTADGPTSIYQVYINATISGTNNTAAHTMPWLSGIAIMDVDTSGQGNSYPGFPGSIYQPAMWLQALNGGQVSQIFGTTDLATLFSC